MTGRRDTLALLAAGAFVRTARAAGWPDRPLRLVVPFPAGGGTDSVARLLADGLAVRLGQGVVVDNRPGASTLIGVEDVVRSTPDGGTLLFSGASTFAILPALRAKMPFDVATDLRPIGIVTEVPLAVVTAGSSRFKTLPELLAGARAAPGELTYSTYGPGSQPHLAAELLADAAAVRLQAVPYKGSADAVVGLLRGEVDIGVEPVAAVGAQVKAGKLRALAVDGAGSSSFLPEVPGMDELGLSKAAIQGFYALAAPARTPAAVIDRLVREVDAVMASPQAVARCADLSLKAVAGTPAGMRDEMRAELQRYRQLNQRLKIALD